MPNPESAISNLRTALKGDDAASIKKAMEGLEKASHKVAEAMYSKTGGAQAPGGAAPASGEAKPPGKEGKGGDEVIDADYEVKE